MLLPSSRAWTPLQKSLIVGAVLTAFAFCASGVWYYERRGRVTDSVFVGTWAFPPISFGPEDIYFRLDPDHTFVAFYEDGSADDSTFRGRWFGGGNFLYFRRPTFDEDGHLTDRPLLIWRVESISPNELQVRLNPDGWPRTVRRVSAQSP